MISTYDRPVCVTTLPTRACNLSCSYCKIVKPFPKLPFEDMKAGYKKVHLKYDLTLWIILGGDVTVFGLEKLCDLTAFLEREGFFYSYTSNSVLVDEIWASALVEAGLSNWSVSLDSLAAVADPDRNEKAQAALRAIELFRERGVEDIHCTITLDRANITQAPEMVEWLTAQGVWAEITPLHYSKSKHYDFSSPPEEMPDIMFRTDDIPMIAETMETLVQMKADGYMVHNMDAYLRAWPELVIDLSWKCSNMWNMTIDSDGALRPCLHLFGNKTRQINVMDIDTIPHADIMEAWHTDVVDQCQGCFWNCQWEVEYIWQRSQSIQLIKDYFAHGTLFVEKLLKETYEPTTD